VTEPHPNPDIDPIEISRPNKAPDVILSNRNAVKGSLARGSKCNSIKCNGESS